MKRGLAVIVAFLALQATIGAAAAQSPAACAKFPALNDEAQKRANAVQTALKAKVERKEVCRLMTAFVASETEVLKFLVDNKTWCQIPDQAITNVKASHEKSLKFREVACTEQAKPRVPTLSDAIKSTPVDTSRNTRAGTGGTFDTLTGNPLQR